MKLSTVPLALLLLSAAAGCNLSDKYCLGDCPETSAGPGDDDTTDGLGGSETGVDPTEEGVPGDPAPTCELPDTIAPAATCLDKQIAPGDLCFVVGTGIRSFPAGVSSALRLLLDDGYFDLLVGHDDGTVTALLYAPGEGVTTLEKPWPQAFPGAVHLQASGDFNGDSNHDVAVRIESAEHPEDASLSVFLLDGEGGLAGVSHLGAGAGVGGPHFYEGDEADPFDLLTITPGGHAVVYLGDGGGDFTASDGFTHPSADNLLVTGVLGSDWAYNDIVFVGDAALDVQMVGPGDALLSIPLAPTDLVHDLQIADIDLDGLGDIIAVLEDSVTHTSELAVILQSTGPGGPQFATTRYTVHCGAVALAIGDLDNDGQMDIVTTSPGDPTSLLTIRINDGAAGFADVVTLQTADPVDDLFVFDLNADGSEDIATVSRAAGSIGVIQSSP